MINMSKKMIKENLRKILLEKEGNKYDYGCVMLMFDVPKQSWSNLQSMIDDDDVYTEEGDQSFGREDEPHITILDGLHATVSDSEIEEISKKIENIDLKLKKISIFENEKFDVVKFDIIGDSNKELSKMNKAFAKLPHTTSYPVFHPHSTIVYVKKGSGKKYIKTLSEDDVIEVKPTHIKYSKVNGENVKYKLN